MIEGTFPVQQLKSIPSQHFDNLLSKRLFFGHQSVGSDIMQGVDEVLQENGKRRLNFIESRAFSDFAGPCFFHFAIGQNSDAVGKIMDFADVVRNGTADSVDIAFMKLCYADIQADTNVEAIFAIYKDTLAQLKGEFPRTLFLHMTMPLVSRERVPKAILKKLLGRKLSGYADNVAREKMNRILRREYAGKEPMFDLAYFESTRKDNQRVAYHLRADSYYALEAAYTDDGGHLNSIGRRFIAEQLLAYLAGL